jgi:hypothetical protein
MDLSGPAIERDLLKGVDARERFINVDHRQHGFCCWID